ncbi:polysaccharide pyruvyl transferase family protein [Stutzerimonas nitrititolerans]|uniref:polysaccharide pyruvyl transferase family protein n=1 Tax=Stutzerimonas nitrititolerans TaxID=2482751 RepID=UPI0028AD3E54|nr:polysaccharide pyruvyl transferase family protein [Stutzerimonas nitrititolerans]
MKPVSDVVKVLHVASFQGNLGDSAMHDGAYRTRAEDCSVEFIYTPLEVREFFHWGRRRFDEVFIDYLNTFDLAIFGGLIGYELWRDDTASGMRFDIAPELLSKIRIPVAFYGLGCDATRGMMHDATKAKCRRFLDAAYERNFLFSLRNDGSRQILEEAIGKSYVEPMPVIADGALFARPRPARTRMLYPAQKLVAINLAGDMPDCRFGIVDERFQRGSPSLMEEAFVQGMLDLSCELLEAEAGVRIVFVPHLYSDLALISKVLERVPDEYRRRYISVSPCLNGGENWSEIFDIYRQAHLVIGMRFHTCVAAIGQGTPTMGIATHHKVYGFFESMQLLDNCVSLTNKEWLAHLTARALNILHDSSEYREDIAVHLTRQRLELKSFHEKLSLWYINWIN